MDIDIQHGYGMQHSDKHAAWTWACIMYIDMQHGHATGSLDMDMQHRHGHAS
jgi:hypothetical protein